MIFKKQPAHWVRALTAQECQLLRPIFRNSIRYESVRVVCGQFLPLQAAYMAMSPKTARFIYRQPCFAMILPTHTPCRKICLFTNAYTFGNMVWATPFCAVACVLRCKVAISANAPIAIKTIWQRAHICRDSIWSSKPV